MGRRHIVRLAGLAGAFAIALTLGAAKGDAADPVCAGKQLCVTITHVPEPASWSPEETDPATDQATDHYVSYEVKVENGGTTSNLVNLTLTMTWADEGIATTTSEFEPAPASSSACTETGTQALTCTTPKSLRPGDLRTYVIVLRTATDLGDPTLSATGTTLTATAGAKEQTTPKQGNTATVTDSETATYEPQPELDVSRAGGGLSTTLATAPGVGGQSSTLPVPAENAPNRATFILTETSEFTCPTGLECFGQEVTTTAPDLSPVNLQIDFTGDLPGGISEQTLVVVHDRFTNVVPDPVTISAECSGDVFFVEPPSGEIPCRRVNIRPLGRGISRVQIDVWDTTNGRFSGGG